MDLTNQDLFSAYLADVPRSIITAGLEQNAVMSVEHYVGRAAGSIVGVTPGRAARYRNLRAAVTRSDSLLSISPRRWCR